MIYFQASQMKKKRGLSVSATELAKMCFCEASVLRQQHRTLEDEQRLQKGKLEHAKFEREVLTSRQSTPGIITVIHQRRPMTRFKRFSLISITIAVITIIICTLLTTNP